MRKQISVIVLVVIIHVGAFCEIDNIGISLVNYVFSITYSPTAYINDYKLIFSDSKPEIDNENTWAANCISLYEKAVFPICKYSIINQTWDEYIKLSGKVSFDLSDVDYEISFFAPRYLDVLYMLKGKVYNAEYVSFLKRKFNVQAELVQNGVILIYGRYEPDYFQDSYMYDIAECFSVVNELKLSSYYISIGPKEIEHQSIMVNEDNPWFRKWFENIIGEHSLTTILPDGYNYKLCVHGMGNDPSGVFLCSILEYETKEQLISDLDIVNNHIQQHRIASYHDMLMKEMFIYEANSFYNDYCVFWKFRPKENAYVRSWYLEEYDWNDNGIF